MYSFLEMDINVSQRHGTDRDVVNRSILQIIIIVVNNTNWITGLVRTLVTSTCATGVF